MDLTTTAGNSSEGFYDDDSTIQSDKIKSLARTYMKATQGVPKYAHFNPINGAYSFIFTYDATIQAPSLMFLSSDYFYPRGYKILAYNKDGLMLKLNVTKAAGANNDYELSFLDNNIHGTDVEIDVFANNP
jgi:hypothetical protein